MLTSTQLVNNFKWTTVSWNGLINGMLFLCTSGFFILLLHFLRSTLLLKYYFLEHEEEALSISVLWHQWLRTHLYDIYISYFRGNLGASHVRLENPAHPVKYQGVVCSMKESFGFIERADVVKEIFFHFSENKSKDELQLGDDVEFIIQTRNVSK